MGEYARIQSERGVRLRFEELMRGLKNEFGPVDAIYKARQHLRRCRHGGRTVKEYVRDFRNLALTLPRATDEELKHSCIDGLGGSGRTEVELQRPTTIQDAVLLSTQVAAALESSGHEVRRPLRGGCRNGNHPRDYRAGGRLNLVGEREDQELQQMVHNVTESGQLMFPLQPDQMGQLLGFLDKAFRRDWFREKVTELLEKAKGFTKQVNLAQEPIVPSRTDLVEYVYSEDEDIKHGNDRVCAVGKAPTDGARSLMQANALLDEKISQSFWIRVPHALSYWH